MLIIFSILFVIGVVGIAAVVTRKIPLVLATPKQVVDDYMEQESARIHVRMLRVKRWFQDREYWDPILFILIRAVRTARIFILKLDRWSFALVQFLNEHYEARKNGEEKPVASEEIPSQPEVAKPQFWDELKAPDKEETPA